MTLYEIYLYCYWVSMLAGGFAIVTLLFSGFGNKTKTLLNGKEILNVEWGSIKFHASTVQLTTAISLCIMIIPLGLIFYLYKEQIIPINPEEVCKEYAGKYSLATDYYFIDDFEAGIRAKAEREGTTWDAECVIKKNGEYILMGEDKTTHSLEVRLENSTKFIHARKFESTYRSVVNINKNGKFEGRRIDSTSGSNKPIINDDQDFTKKIDELSPEEKKYIEKQIVKYEKMRNERRSRLSSPCFITKGKDRGVDVVGFTCLDSYTRVMRRNL